MGSDADARCNPRLETHKGRRVARAGQRPREQSVALVARLWYVVRLATWNVNSLKVRLAQLLDWLGRERPDVVCLQETKTEDANFPAMEIERAGYRALFSGQRLYNGVAILARVLPSDPFRLLPGFADEQKRVLAATVDGMRIVCVYVPNGES